MRFPVRSRLSALLTGACAVLLVFATAASAETRTGESTTATNHGTPSGEITLMRAAASYESTAGTVVIALTTAAPAAAHPAGEDTVEALLLQAPGECSPAGTLTAPPVFPYFKIAGPYVGPNPEATLYPSETTIEVLGHTGKGIVGSATSFSLSSSQIANFGFNCAIVGIGENREGLSSSSFMVFPISVPETHSTSETGTTTAPSMGSAPAAFSIASPKPLKLKVDKWKTVKVKVTNTGATASTEGSLRAKPAKGVKVKPGTQKLPALAPGQTTTVSVRVELTEKAKKKSTLAVTASAPGLSAKSSIVAKLAA